MPDLHKNFALSTIVTIPSPAISGTTLIVASGQGALFPTPPFNVTIWPANTMPTAANAEIVRVIARSTDTFTIVRGQEGTTPRTIVTGDYIAATITAKVITDIEATTEIVPNGTDTAALTEWLNAGSNLFLPKATYTVSSQVLSSITRDKLRIRVHPEAKIIAASGYPAAGGGMIQITGTDHVNIEGIDMEGNSLTTSTLDPSSNNSNAIWINNAISVMIKEGKFSKQPKAAVRTDNCQQVTILDTIVDTENFAFDINNGISVNIHRNKIAGRGQYQADNSSLGGNQTTAIFIKDCLKSFCSYNEVQDYRGTAMKSEGCNKSTFINNEIDKFGKEGVKIQGSVANPTVEKGIMLGNIVSNRRHWMTDGIAYLEFSNVKNFVAKGNVLTGDGMSTYQGPEAGMFIQSSVVGFTVKNGVIEGNPITNMGSYGIYATPRLSNTIIAHNPITNWSTISATGHAILLETDCDNIDILDNRIYNESMPTTTGSHAINITGTNVNIDGVKIKNCRGEGIRYRPSSGDYFNVINSSIVGTNNVGIYVVLLNGTVVVTLDNIKINGNTFTRNCLTGGFRAAEIYAGNLSNDLDIGLMQYAGNTVNKGGTSATTSGLGFFNDGFGSVAKLNYQGNIYATGIDADPTYGFSPAVITTN